MADKYRWYATNRDGKTVEGNYLTIREKTGLSEYQVRRSSLTNKRFNGWIVYKEEIDYENVIYDIVDEENNIIFTGTNEQATRKFGYKRIDLKKYLDDKMRVHKKYRVYRHNEYEKPKYHQESVEIANMLKIYGNTCANGRTLERVLRELKQMGIRVDIEKSHIFKNGYVLTRRENAEARS